MKKGLIILILFLILLPSVSLAVAGTYIADGATICYEGLVPCGKEVFIGGTTSGGKCVGGTGTTIPCQLCHFFVMLDGIIDFVLFKLVLPIATLMIVIAGIMYLGAIFEFLPGGFKTLTQAKEVLAGVTLGLFIIFSAWLILNLFFTAIGVAKWTKLKPDPTTGSGWFQIECPIKI